MSKIKEMVSAVVTGNQSLDPTKIAKSVNKRFKDANVTEKDINNFLQSEFYPEIEYTVERHKGFEGEFYI